MLKSPKNKGFFEQQKILIKNYNIMLSIIDSYTYVITDSIFEATKKNIENKIIFVSKNSIIKNNDENVYDYCHSIVRSYIDIVELYENNKEFIISPEKINILEGICSVLLSKIKQFYDENKNSKENPILSEKESIIEKSTDFFEKQFKQLLISYTEEK